VTIGVIITDSFGRAWRKGSQGVALGASGVPAFVDLRGAPDLHGRTLRVSEIAPADSLAAAAVLMMGEAAEATPLVLIRGGGGGTADEGIGPLLRDPATDLFR
jgi:coenzyme F420-0:L-glutamate ligase / coenzyme F420-1:gamma-L-glutamate ligase